MRTVDEAEQLWKEPRVSQSLSAEMDGVVVWDKQQQHVRVSLSELLWKDRESQCAVHFKRYRCCLLHCTRCPHRMKQAKQGEKRCEGRAGSPRRILLRGRKSRGGLRIRSYLACGRHYLQLQSHHPPPPILLEAASVNGWRAATEALAARVSAPVRKDMLKIYVIRMRTTLGIGIEVLMDNGAGAEARLAVTKLGGSRSWRLAVELFFPPSINRRSESSSKSEQTSYQNTLLH